MRNIDDLYFVQMTLKQDMRGGVFKEELIKRLQRMKCVVLTGGIKYNDFPWYILIGFDKKSFSVDLMVKEFRKIEIDLDIVNYYAQGTFYSKPDLE
jgi:hypothetical protein